MKNEVIVTTTVSIPEDETTEEAVKIPPIPSNAQTAINIACAVLLDATRRLNIALRHLEAAGAETVPE